ncbi:hypothetical protein [Pseudenhygromyxa sp. WMMC2535]|nr:hypothetical protein [Pseudenhygromyxa sp. WMMC2535]
MAGLPATDEPGQYSVRVSPRGWHVGLAFDVLRAFTRANRLRS